VAAGRERGQVSLPRAGLYFLLVNMSLSLLHRFRDSIIYLPKFRGQISQTGASVKMGVIPHCSVSDHDSLVGLLSPVHTSNNVEATFDFVERIVG